jgi:circadian clock protein KaiC
MERVKTGIEGLDKILNGGLPKGSTVLISGGAGTGKTILSLQYFYNGAKKFNEPGLFISTEQTEKELKEQVKEFGWDLDKLEKRGLIKIVKVDLTKGAEIIKIIKKHVKNIKAKRLVVDSLTTLTEFLSTATFKEKGFELVKSLQDIVPVPLTESLVTKNILFKILDELKKLNCTILVTSELPEQSNWLSRDTVSEFLCDGVIILHYVGIGGIETASLQIRKMRYSSYEKGYVPFEITKGGIKLKPEEVTTVLLK